MASIQATQHRNEYINLLTSLYTTIHIIILFSPSESDDSDDEIIVKTLWPVHQAPTNGIRDYKDQDGDFQRSTKNNHAVQKDDLEGKVESGNKENFKVNGETGGNSDAEDEVIEKVRRGRMEFPCSSECNASPAKSCLNGNSSSLCDNSHHKSKTSTTKANHPGN